MDSTSRPTYPTSVNLLASTFEEWGIGELCKAARNLRLTDSGWPDHEDVL